VGVDWGSEEQAICVVDAAGTVRGERRVVHSAVAVADAITWVQTRPGVAPAAIAVAIETRRGVWVDTFLEQGFAVFAINPKQRDRLRDRVTPAGAKDDRRDAHVLGDGLRTDARAFRPVTPDDPQIIQLRELCRIEEELQEQRRRLANRRRDQLFRIDAPWLTLSPAAADPWLWTVLRDAPDPAAWARLNRRALAAVVRQHRIRRWTADDVIAALQQPRLAGAAGGADAGALRIASLVPQLLLGHEQHTATQRRIERALEGLVLAGAADEPREHRDVEILRSLPGAGRMVTATMRTEAAAAIGDRDYSMLRTQAGTAPVTKRSGKRAYTVQMRSACKPRLRNAL
jgi:transposase